MKITVEKGRLENVEANKWLWSVLLRGKVPGECRNAERRQAECRKEMNIGKTTV